MITSTQYALLVCIPTSTIIIAACIMSWHLRRFLRTMHANFDRIEKSLNEASARSTPYKSAFEPQ